MTVVCYNHDIGYDFFLLWWLLKEPFVVRLFFFRPFSALGHKDGRMPLAAVLLSSSVAESRPKG